MQIIVEKNEYACSLVGKQKPVKGVEYRLFKYVKKCKIDQGYLLFNTLIGEMVFISDEEEKQFSLNFCDNPNYLDLITKYYFVPIDFNDLLLMQQFSQINESINSIWTDVPLTNFTILTTTDCNARCFYCYQSGCKHLSMSLKTAEQTARFIISKSRGKKIFLRWFGGEPLYNIPAIDKIIKILKNNNINFESKMTTNGYLFDEDVIHRAICEWHLKKVQITLDGTENIYNRVKNYINNDTNAFIRVTDNIEMLLKNDIQVRIRMNLDKHNADDLFFLCDYLISRYGKYEKFTSYVHLLFDDSCIAVRNHSTSENEELAKICRQLNEKLSKHKQNNFSLDFEVRYRNHCMADMDCAIMILPDGKLSKCDHFLDEKTVGNIYSGITNYDVVSEFKKVSTVCDECDECVYRLCCSNLDYCSGKRTHCSDFDKIQRDEVFERKMIAYYRKIKGSKR